VSKTLFAPRLGLIYRINEATVFRTGYGQTINPLPFTRPLRGFYPLTIAINPINPNNFQPYSTLSQGIPPVVGPDLSSGRIPLPNTVDMRTPELDLSRGRAHSWNVAIERRLALDLSVDLAYVGTKSNGGFADLDINASDTPGGGPNSRPFAQQFGRTRDLKSWGPRLKTEYHSLQVAINRPFKNGLLLKGAYTFSKSMGESISGEDGWVGVEWNAPSQYHRNWSLQPFDRPHVFQLAFVYELPFMRQSSGVAAALVKDWQVNGTFSAYSGLPFNVTGNGNLINMPGNLQTADQIGEYEKVGEIGNSGTWFDTGAFRQPVGVTFGNMGRMSVRGPSARNLDFSVFRTFSLGGTRRLEFRTEVFNITNTPKFGNPNGDVNSANFGRIFATASEGLVAERQIRLGFRFSF
jgi:hypothetical protein